MKKMMSLSDGLVRWEFDITGDPPDINEEPQVPTSHIFGNAGKEFGDWEPGHSHIQQKSWIGGRGNQEFTTDESRFFDSRNLWNFTPEHLHPAPQWRFAEKTDTESITYLPTPRPIAIVGTNVRFKRLDSTAAYSRRFEADSSSTYVQAKIWVRRHGQPTGNLTMAIFADDGGTPAKPTSEISGTSGSVTYTALREEDISQIVDVTISYALTSGTKYHFVVYTDAAGTEFDYFEIGYGNGGAEDQYNGAPSPYSSWTAEQDIQIFWRITLASWFGRWFHFDMEGARYAVTNKDNDTTSALYINGDRGIATSATSTTIKDTGKTWSHTDLWLGAWVRITKGTGKGQYAEITGSSGDTLTVTAWPDKTPDTTSEYVIYATDRWYPVTIATVALTDKVVSPPAVFNNQVLFPYGSATNMLRVRWNSGTPGHEGNAESKKADHVVVTNHPSTGVSICRGENDAVDVSFAEAKAWATDLSFGTEIQCGDATDPMTGLSFHEQAVWVRKQGALGKVQNDKYTEVPIGLSTMAQATNGVAATSWNLMFYVNWAYSIEQIMGSNVDDMGPWLNAGLPDRRRGVVSALEPTQAVMYAGIDAGREWGVKEHRISGVYGWNKTGYGNIFEAWLPGRRVRGVHYQACPGTQDRLWFDVDGEMALMELPDESLNMLNDSGMNYQHEAIFISSTVDMNAHRIKKLFNSLSLTTRNLAAGVTIYAQYQVDNDIDGSVWYDIGEFNRSDFQERGIWQGNRRRIRIRLIFRTNDSKIPPVLRSWVIEAYGRIPVKYQWTIRIPVKSLTVTGSKINRDPDKFIKWLKSQGEDAGSLVMGSIWPDLDGMRVLVEPPSVIRLALNRVTKAKVLEVTVAIRES